MTRPIALLGGILGAGGLGISSAATGETPRCTPEGARTILATDVVRVVATPGGDVAACDRRTGKLVSLSETFTTVAPPAIAVSGSRVAVVRSVLIDPAEDAFEIVVVVGSPRSARRPQEAFVYAGNESLTAARAAVEPGGAAALLTCAGNTPYLFERVPPACPKPGQNATVYAISRGGRVRKLDEGRSINPAVLRISRGRVIWRRHGRDRSARLVP